MQVNKKMWKSAQEFYSISEELNEQGVRKHGCLWLGANEEMVGILRSWGINPATPGVRQFSMLIVSRLGKHFTRPDQP